MLLNMMLEWREDSCAAVRTALLLAWPAADWVSTCNTVSNLYLEHGVRQAHHCTDLHSWHLQGA